MDGQPSALVTWVAQQMSLRRDPFIDGLAQATRVQIRSLDHDARMVDLLTASITENVVVAIHFLEHGGHEEDVEAPSAAVVYARALAQRDVPLSALIRAYRIGHNRFIDEAMSILATHPPQSESLSAAAELVHQAAVWIDRICDQVGQAYERERDRWVSSRSGLRQHWVSQVLAGGPVDIGRAEDALRYRFDRWHLGAVVWADDDVAATDLGALVDDARTVVGEQLKALGPALMVPTDEREARMWWPISDAALQPGDAVAGALLDAGVAARLAFGTAGRGVDGFRRTMREAERAQLVAEAGAVSDPARRVVPYAAVAPVALMVDHPAELRRFVGTVLGELATDDERNGWLRDTLREFLARNRSYADAADALYLHRNTIRYRVAQALDKCGATLDDPDLVVQIQVALLVCRWLGRSVLTVAP
ncbi:helix-turn-helix domain-containing protein [Mycobacteroides abscessus subsp. bolletii]|nr:helix-turn-helix domain-containing protein [Mycobacteroides abscessus]MDO2968217.1 helix-turn-helix domain-containing protein [Mycobacteroides abscessus subsp. bolletii]MDO3080441.1 helix-turn-helix domain-containing protein [Mycobacteroides abscessus subsp. bolletii]SKK53597.1 putative regulatory protein [Mycobacteroides abscessus subsp. bolletii]